jgi:hypothetical protein
MPQTAATTSANSTPIATPVQATPTAVPAPAAVAAPTATTTTAQVVTATVMTSAQQIVQPNTTSTTRTETPFSSSTRSAAPASAKEKKSAADTSEGSFIQSGSSTASTTSTASNLTTAAVTAVDNASGNQQVATNSTPARNGSNNAAASSISSVGTARDENRSTMNTDLTLPAEMIAGATASTTSSNAPEVNILLSSNNDFSDALKQVVHIAQLNEATGTTNPTRVAIELQTPPGAIVNVYVSKQDDSYRAQLSTNDPAALSWVQDQISSLRQNNDLGVEVKWLPAQIEGTSSLSATTTPSDGSGLNWNRDGQQQNNPQSDDQSQYQRQNSSSYEDLTEAEAESFASSFVTAGGVA